MLCGYKKYGKYHNIHQYASIYIKRPTMNNKKTVIKNEFLRLRLDSVEKNRLELLCTITRRQKSDIVRESLFELYKLKYPECLS